MTSTKALAHFTNDFKTRIVADAGSKRLGAVFLQFQGEEWRAVSYASRNLSDVGRRYAQTEKETLAFSKYSKKIFRIFRVFSSGFYSQNN